MEIKSANFKETGLLLGGMGLVGIPVLAAYLGRLQSEAESRLDKDKDFVVRDKKLKMLQEAVDAVRS